MPDYTVDVLLTDIRTTASIPNAQPRFDDDAILRIATRVMQTKIVPMMMSAREEFFVDYEDHTIVQGNTSGYPIPSRAVGSKVKNVVLVNQSGLLNLTNLPRLSIEQVGGYYFGQVVPFGFYIEDNRIILWPVNQTTPANTVRFYFLKRRNELTLTDNCRQVVEVTGNNIRFADVPAAWVNGTLLDAIDAAPPFDTQADDMAISNVSGDTITVSDASDVSVGDWVAPAQESPIPQIPVEAHQLLVQLTSLEILKSLGDTEGYQKLEVEAQQLSRFIETTIEPRSEGNLKKCISGGNAIADWCGFRWRGS